MMLGYSLQYNVVFNEGIFLKNREMTYVFENSCGVFRLVGIFV